MSLEYKILVGVWILSCLLILTIPRDKFRLAAFAFLFKQWITCLLGLLAVQLGLLQYPVRELADINRTSFTYEFLAYPMVCAVFNVYYPAQKKPVWQFAYYLVWITALTIPEVILEKHTNLIRYVHWNWFCTWSSLFFTFLATRVFCVLYFRSLSGTEANPGRQDVS
jgi:hypothetical protein